MLIKLHKFFLHTDFLIFLSHFIYGVTFIFIFLTNSSLILSNSNFIFVFVAFFATPFFGTVFKLKPYRAGQPVIGYEKDKNNLILILQMCFLVTTAISCFLIFKDILSNRENARIDGICDLKKEMMYQKFSETPIWSGVLELNPNKNIGSFYDPKKQFDFEVKFDTIENDKGLLGEVGFREKFSEFKDTKKLINYVLRCEKDKKTNQNLEKINVFLDIEEIIEQPRKDYCTIKYTFVLQRNEKAFTMKKYSLIPGQYSPYCRKSGNLTLEPRDTANSLEITNIQRVQR
jgi:hypothetical protein